MGRLRNWIDRHRIASFLLVTYAFTWSIQAVVVAAGMEASWTMSILTGFGGFDQSVGVALVVQAPGGVPDPWLNFLAQVTGAIPLLAVAVLVVLVSGSRRLANREVPGREILGLD